MADRTNTDIPAIKKGHESGNGFPFYRASGINTVPELVDQFQFFRFLAVTEVAGKAYTAEPFGEHMHEEGVQELGSAHMHGLGFSIIRVIFVVERHTGIIYGINPAVADGAAEYVARKISGSVAGPVKCFLDMRDPVFMVKPAHGILWEKVPFMGSFHKLAGGSQPPAGKHGMDMGMEIQPLALRMQYGNNPGSCPEMLSVTA